MSAFRNILGKIHGKQKRTMPELAHIGTLVGTFVVFKEANLVARVVSNGAQFFMTIYALNASPISPPIVVACGVVALLASLVEVLLDGMFPPRRGA